MGTKQHQGIKVGDLVKFKHHIFDEHRPVHLVTEVEHCHDGTKLRMYADSLRHGGHRASAFVVVSRP